MTVPAARIARVAWWRRLLSRFHVVHWPSELRDLNELADERVRLALNNQLADLLEHIHDRDREIGLLRDQVRELGGAPVVLDVYRKPPPTFIPGPGIRVSR